jgi:sec-independent protein translocase protein TatA
MFGLHWTYLIIIFVVVLIIFGPGRLPELGGAIGKAMREFRKATTELTNEVTSATQAKPESPTSSAAPTPESSTKGPTSEANLPKS